MKTLFLDNINKKLNIIQIIFNENNLIKSNFFKESKINNYHDFFKNISFINYYLYEEKEIIKLIEKDELYFKLYNETKDKIFFIKLFIINYHNGGFIINKEFYIMNEQVLSSSFESDKFILDKEENIIFNPSCLYKYQFNHFTDKLTFLNEIKFYYYNDLKFFNYDKFNNHFDKNILNNFYLQNPIHIIKNEEYQILDKPVKFLIKSERNSGSNYFEKLLSYYFDCNYSEKNYFYKNYSNWKHSKLNLIDIEDIKNKKLISVFIKKDIFSWIQSIFNNPYEVKPESKIFETFIKQKCYDYLPFNLYNEIHKKNDCLNFNNIFDMYYQKYNNFLNVNLDNKLYLNYEDILNNHYEIIKYISKNFNLPIIREYNQDFNNYNKKKFYLNKEYLKKYSDTVYNYVLDNINIEIEDLWNHKLTKFTYSQNELIKYKNYISTNFAVIYYFDDIKNIFQLKLSIYLFEKLGIKADIFVFYKNDFNVSEFSNKIRFIKCSNILDIYQPNMINEKFSNFKYLIYLNYDFFLDDNISNFFYKLQDNKLDIIFFNIRKIIFNKDNLFKFNKLCDQEIYKNLDFDITEFIDENILILNIKSFQNNNLLNYFENLNKFNISVKKKDFYFYLQQLNLNSLNLDIKYYTNSLN